MRSARAQAPASSAAPRTLASSRLVARALMHPPRALPSWFVRGAASPELLDAVTGLRDRSLLDAERALLERAAPRIAGRADAPVTVVELGADGRPRVAPLLDAILAARPGVVWAPLNASEHGLGAARVSLARRDPRLEILPLGVDPRSAGRALGGLPGPRVVIVPAGRLAALELDDAAALLRSLREVSSPLDTWLLAFDRRVGLAEAGDDPRGVAERLAFGALDRLARELGADFDRRAFRHEARWCDERSRVEHHLVARLRQPVFVDALGQPLLFQAGESLVVETCQRHPDAVAERLLADAGLARVDAWEYPGAGVRLVLARAG